MYRVPAKSPTARLFENKMPLCTYFPLSEESKLFLRMTFLGHYLTRCTWRRKLHARDINYGIISDPGALSGCFPGISIPQLSSYFGSSPNSQKLLSCELHVKTALCIGSEICHNPCLCCLYGADSGEPYSSYRVKVSWIGDVSAAFQKAALEQGNMYALGGICDKVANQATLSFKVLLPLSCMRIIILKNIVQ